MAWTYSGIMYNIDIYKCIVHDITWSFGNSLLIAKSSNLDMRSHHYIIFIFRVHTTQRCVLLACSCAAQAHAHWIRKGGTKATSHILFVKGLTLVTLRSCTKSVLYIPGIVAYMCSSSSLDISLRRCVEGQGAVFLDVSSPSSLSVLTEDRSATESPSQAVASLFSDSSIQNIVDRYTRELNISLRGTGRTTGAYFFNLSR